MKSFSILGLLMLNIFCIYSQKSKHLKYEELVRLPSDELIEKGNGYLEDNEKDTALMFYLVLSAKYNDQMSQTEQYLCALGCVKSGTIFYQKGNYSKAFEVFLKGLSICEKHNFFDLLPELYKNIGNVYCIFQDFDQGNASYEKALTLSVRQGDVDMQVKILNNLSGMYCYGGDTGKAKYYYRQMRQKSKGKKDVLQEYFNYLNWGLICASEQKYDSAMACYRASASYAVRAQLEPRYKSSSYFELAKLYEKIGQRDSALYYFDLIVSTVRHNNLLDMLAESLKSLTRIYQKKGDKQNEQLYRAQYLQISDSIFNLQELSKLKNTQFLYEMDQTMGKIDSLNEEKAEKELEIKVQQRVLFGISVGLCVFVVLLVVVYVQKRKLRLAYVDLFRRNSEILKFEEQRKKVHTEYEEKLTAERKHSRALSERLKQMMLESAEDDKEQIVRTEDIANQSDELRKTYPGNKLTDERKENILRDICSVMENNEELCNCDFGLERLATLIGSNSHYVSQVINDTYGKNLRTYINEYRIKEAQLRLMNTKEYGNYTIKAIAESVGYKSHANFIAIFKKTTGINPSLYQKIVKEGK